MKNKITKFIMNDRYQYTIQGVWMGIAIAFIIIKIQGRWGIASFFFKNIKGGIIYESPRKKKWRKKGW